MEKVFREIIEEWLVSELPKDIVEREVAIEPSDIITAIIGPRRAGKTYLMYASIKKLLSNFEKENILYVDFSDIRLRNLTSQNFSTFLKVMEETLRENQGKLFLFLDEVQEIDAWEYWVRTLYNKGKYFIVVSGSSSKLLSREISTQLRGRYISKIILPFSFREFLKAKRFEAKYLHSPTNKGKLLKLLKKYISFGGFPEVVINENKKDLLKSYVDTIFYKDVVERYNIRDIAGCEIFLRILMENFGKKFSISKTHNYFRSLGIKKSKKTVWNYLKYFKEAFFVSVIEKFSFNIKERMQYPIKIYAIDTGFYLHNDLGLKMENIVATELLRREKEYFYFETKEGHEVDFLIKENLKVKQLIQVTYANSFDEIEHREIRALLKAKEMFKEDNPELLIITWDYEDEKEVSWFGRSGKIKFMPLWKWLLNL